MSSIRDPKEKKRLSLARDYRTLAEYPKGHRHCWPRAKAGMNRQFRRVARMALAGEVATGTDTDAAALSETMTALPHPTRWPAMPLAEWISKRLEERSLRAFAKVRRRANRQG